MDMPQQIRLQELFSRYLEKRSEPAEVAELVGLLEQADAAEALTEPMRILWEELKVRPVEYPVVDWDSMYSRISQVEDDLSILNRRRGRRLTIRHYAVAAAVLLLLAIPAFFLIQDNKRGVSLQGDLSGNGGIDGKGLVKDSRGLKEDSGKVGDISAGDKRRVVHLPDGSTVLLNRHSRLEYPIAFTGSTREVRLTGEAYFDISRRLGQPFLVHSGRLTTRVLGTAFNVRAYPSDKSIEVTVTEGKVQVMEAGRNMGLLTNNQQIHFDTGTDSFVENRAVNVRPIVAWRPQEIRFDDLTMDLVVKRLEERYNLTVVLVNPALSNCRVTAAFYEDDGLDELLSVVCAVSQSTFQVREGVVRIDGKGCN
jgi:transmembrane sensor